MRLQHILEKYLPLISGMLVPAMIFAVGLLWFLAAGGFDFGIAGIFHWFFYGLGLFNLLVLLNFNRGKPLFFTIIIILSYVLLNYFKQRFGADFASTVWYRDLEVLVPLNLLVFYWLGNRHFFGRTSLWMLLGIISQYTIVEFLGRYDFSVSFVWHDINLPSVVAFVALTGCALFYAVKDGRFADYGILFASLSIWSGFYNAAEASGLSIFFFMAQFELSISLIYTLIHNHYYDETTGFFSRNSYLLQSRHFPLKYSLGIISIDNYDKLATTLGHNKMNRIIVMLAGILEDMNPEDHIYRYGNDEFIVIYKRLDKKEAFKHLDDIRRNIAGVAFEYAQGKKPLKLTVSCSVAEKKRSDSGAVEVLVRADKALRQTLKFSHNVTSQG